MEGGDKLYIQGATVPLIESGQVRSVRPATEPGDPPQPNP
jgi:hypothetical protein